MLTPHLNETQLAEIQKFLASWLLSRGPEILGSQLGTGIFKVLETPVREFGGLRTLVEQELSALLTIAGTDPDLHFIIKADLAASPAAAQAANDNDVLRIFANPRLEGLIGVSLAGQMAVANEQTPLSEEFRQISKPSAEEFHALAKEFAVTQDAEFQSELAKALDSKDYNEWIRTLRQLATPKTNLARNWEAVRADFVNRRLHDELVRAGVPSIKASEIAGKSRAAPRQKPQPTPQARRLAKEPVEERFLSGDEIFRQTIHKAIDSMSLEELRRLPIAAGLMFDASR